MWETFGLMLICYARVANAYINPFRRWTKSRWHSRHITRHETKLEIDEIQTNVTWYSPSPFNQLTFTGVRYTWVPWKLSMLWISPQISKTQTEQTGGTKNSTPQFQLFDPIWSIGFSIMLAWPMWLCVEEWKCNKFKTKPFHIFNFSLYNFFRLNNIIRYFVGIGFLNYYFFFEIPTAIN